MQENLNECFHKEGSHFYMNWFCLVSKKENLIRLQQSEIDMIVKHPEKPKVIIVQNILKEYSNCFFLFPTKLYLLHLCYIYALTTDHNLDASRY